MLRLLVLGSLLILSACGCSTAPAPKAAAETRSCAQLEAAAERQIAFYKACRDQVNCELTMQDLMNLSDAVETFTVTCPTSK